MAFKRRRLRIRRSLRKRRFLLSKSKRKRIRRISMLNRGGLQITG